MRKKTPTIAAVAWKDNSLELLDQTKLPGETIFIRLTTIEAVYEAIRSLRVRGAPAIGITAAYGLYLGMCDEDPPSAAAFFALLAQKIEYLAAARPTAVNLFWAMQSLRDRLAAAEETDIIRLKEGLLARALELHEDDRQRCERMAAHGQAVVGPKTRILTHCNTGALATGGIGTALGVIIRAHQLGKQIHVYANETRPVLQGARLTAWELTQARVPFQLTCDSMGAALMQQKKVDLVILGADRIAADGSVANKIGTYNLAVLAHYHQIPFYVVAPLSTFDRTIANGRSIPIEVRSEEEIRRVMNQCLITVPDAPCWNPAFDVTPPDLVTGIITEKGIITPPYPQNIESAFAEHTDETDLLINSGNSNFLTN